MSRRCSLRTFSGQEYDAVLLRKFLFMGLFRYNVDITYAWGDVSHGTIVRWKPLWAITEIEDKNV